MTRKRRNPKPKSFIEDMFNSMRKDPALGPMIDFMETLNKNPYWGGRIEPFPVIIPNQTLQIQPEMYRKLLMLCHPDKHNNSETATEVTRWLIEQRSMYE